MHFNGHNKGSAENYGEQYGGYVFGVIYEYIFWENGKSSSHIWVRFKKKTQIGYCLVGRAQRKTQIGYCLVGRAQRKFAKDIEVLSSE